MRTFNNIITALLIIAATPITALFAVAFSWASAVRIALGKQGKVGLR